MKIGIMSDTHGFIHPRIYSYFNDCDEIWHIGDIGNVEVLDELVKFKPVRAVYGNIDGGKLKTVLGLDNVFEIEGVKVYMTHIGGYPGRYSMHAKGIIAKEKPQLFLSGHSHILKVMRDHKNQLLHINPGACGKVGFHKVKTIVRIEIQGGRILNPEVIELID